MFNIFRRSQILFFQIILMLFICAAISLNAFAGSDSKSKLNTILVIASYNPDTQRMSGFLKDFESKILKEDIQCNVAIENLACRGFDESLSWINHMDDIIRRYENDSLSAIVLLGQEAFVTFLSCDIKPKGVPFFGSFASANGVTIPSVKTDISTWESPSVDMIEWARSCGLSGGYLNKYDVDKNMDLILTLYPQTKNIVFVSDNTYGGISMQAYVKERMKKYSELNLILIDGRVLETDEAISEIGKLPKQSVILLGTWRVGTKGQYVMSHLNESLIIENPDIPVFSISGSGVGGVAVGGFVPYYDSHAEDIANQIIEYNDLDVAPKFFETDGYYYFDAQLLKKFGIKEYQLPKGSIVESRLEAEISFYRRMIIFSLIALMVVAIIVVIVVLMLRRNTRLKRVLEQQNLELIEEKEKAERSDKLKSAFLANMSHEIRTPLNAIVGFSSIMAQVTTQEEKDEFLNIIQKNNDLLLQLIGDVLDFSKIESGIIEFNYSNFEINECLEGIAKSFTLKINEGVEIKKDIPEKKYIIYSEQNRLMQVVTNFMSNAIKFTKEGYIKLSCQILDEGIKISVKDTGIGIGPEFVPKVFDRFEKFNMFTQGTGLGLSISKSIIETMKGQIGVDSKIGEGSTFWCYVPCQYKEVED